MDRIENHFRNTVRPSQGNAALTFVLVTGRAAKAAGHRNAASHRAMGFGDIGGVDDTGDKAVGSRRDGHCVVVGLVKAAKTRRHAQGMQATDIEAIVERYARRRLRVHRGRRQHGKSQACCQPMPQGQTCHATADHALEC